MHWEFFIEETFPFPLCNSPLGLQFTTLKQMDSKFFFSSKFNVFKKGKILPGITQYMLDNVWSLSAWYHPMNLSCSSESMTWQSSIVPFSLQSFYVMMFQPRKINDSELKTCKQEQEHINTLFQGKLPRLVFLIKLQDSLWVTIAKIYDILKHSSIIEISPLNWNLGDLPTSNHVHNLIEP